MSYVSDKMDVTEGGLTRDSLHHWLEEAGVSSDLAQRVEDTLTVGEEARYSPVGDGTGRREELTERTDQLLTDLEEAFGGMTRSWRLLCGTLAALVALMAVTMVVNAQGPAATDLMAEANARYDREEYAEAVQLYESLVGDGYHETALYYNLGNAHLGNGDLGEGDAELPAC